MQRHYSRKNRKMEVLMLAAAMVIAFCGWYGMMRGMAEARQVQCWVLCKPGAQVMIRERPDKGSPAVGFLEAGDPFMTDAETKDGWIRAYGVGDGGGWIYCGYVAEDRPQKIFAAYRCTANDKVQCRKWCGGPRIDGRNGWLHGGSTVQVFYMTDDWCVTSRGYIRTEYLEAEE